MFKGSFRIENHFLELEISYKCVAMEDKREPALIASSTEMSPDLIRGRDCIGKVGSFNGS